MPPGVSVISRYKPFLKIGLFWHHKWACPSRCVLNTWWPVVGPLAPPAPDQLAVTSHGCVNVCMNGWMLGNIVKHFEWPWLEKRCIKAVHLPWSIKTENLIINPWTFLLGVKRVCFAHKQHFKPALLSLTSSFIFYIVLADSPEDHASLDVPSVNRTGTTSVPLRTNRRTALDSLRINHKALPGRTGERPGITLDLRYFSPTSAQLCISLLYHIKVIVISMNANDSSSYIYFLALYRKLEYCDNRFKKKNGPQDST